MKKRNRIISVILSVMMTASVVHPVSFGAKGEEQDAEQLLKDYTGRYIVKYKPSSDGMVLENAVDSAFNKAKQSKDEEISSIKAREEGKSQEIDRLLREKRGYSASSLSVLSLGNGDRNGYQTIQLDEAVAPAEFINALEKEARTKIEYIQPDYVMELSAAEENAVKQEENNVYINVTDEALTVDISEANLTDEPEVVPANEVTVALLDTGVDVTHSELAERIVNPYDFVKDTGGIESKTGSMEYNHGTHIAGVILSNAPETKIMPLKVFENGKAYTSDILNAIVYAKANGADIVNCSWGSREENTALREAIEESGLTFVCAAGNNGVNVEDKPYYPAAFDLDNIISVASVNDDCALSYFSNYGTDCVDIAARGNNIESAYPNNEHGHLSGTSVGAGFVSGAAAQYLRFNTADSLKTELLSSADKISCLGDKIKDGNLLNMDNLLNHINGKNITINAEDIRNPIKRSPEENWELFSLQNNIKMAAMKNTSIFVKGDGSVWMMGEHGYPEQAPFLENIIDVDANDDECMFVDVSGKVYTWDGYERLPGEDNYNAPKEFDFGGVKSISCGPRHYLVLKNDGTIWGWGANEAGQAGGTEVDQYYDEVQDVWIPESYLDVAYPVQVANGSMDITKAKSIFASNQVSYAIGEDNVLYHWGAISYFTIGTPLPEYMDQDVRIITADSEYNYPIIVYNNGDVRYNGTMQEFTLSDAVEIKNYLVLNSNGSLKEIEHDWIYAEDWSDRWISSEKIMVYDINNISNVRNIAASRDVSDGVHKFRLVIKTDDTVWGWGHNENKQLSNSTETYFSDPIKIVKGNDITQEAKLLVDEQYNNPDNSAYHLNQQGLQRLGWSEYNNREQSGNGWQKPDLGEFSAESGQLVIKKTGDTSQPSIDTPNTALVYSADKQLTYREDNWQGDPRVSMWTNHFKGKYQIEITGSFHQTQSQMYYDVMGGYAGGELISARYRIDPGANGAFSVYNNNLNGGNTNTYPLWKDSTIKRTITTELDSEKSQFKTYIGNRTIPIRTTVDGAEPADTFGMTGWNPYSLISTPYITGIRISGQKQTPAGNTLAKIDSVKLYEVEPAQDEAYKAVHTLNMSYLTDTPDAVTTDLKPLPNHIGNAWISWTSSDYSVMWDDGTLTDTEVYGDKEVIMTAKIENHDDLCTRYMSFKLTVTRPNGFGEKYLDMFTGTPTNTEEAPTETIPNLPMWKFTYPGIKNGANHEIHDSQILERGEFLIFKKLSDRQTANYNDCLVGWRWLDRKDEYQSFVGKAKLDIVAKAFTTGTFRFSATALNEKMPFILMLDSSAKNIGIVYGEEADGNMIETTQRININPSEEHKYSLIIDTGGTFELQIDGNTINTEAGETQRHFLKGTESGYAISKLKAWITNVTMANSEVGLLRSVEFTPIEDRAVQAEKDILNDLGVLYRDYIPSAATQNLTLPSSLPNGSTVSWNTNYSSIISSQGKVNSPAGESRTTVKLTAAMTKDGVTRAYIFDVLVPKFCKFVTPGSIDKNGILNLNFNVKNISNMKNKEFIVEYSPEEMELEDASMFTMDNIVKRGAVENTDIVITELAPGKLSFFMNTDIPQGKLLSAAINGVKFKSLKNGTKAVTCSIEQTN